MNLTRRSRRLMLGLLGATAVFAFAHLIMWRNRAWFVQLPGDAWKWFDLNAETSFGTWFSVSVLLLLGVAAALAAAAESPGRRRIAWLSIAIGTLLLSVDDQISAHERLPEFFGMARQTMATHEWLLPGVILGGGLALTLIWLAAPLELATRRGLLIGLIVFALGAVIVEGLSGWLTRTLPRTHPLYLAMPTFVLVEEVLEKIGSIIALVTVVSHLERNGVIAMPHRRSNRSRARDGVEGGHVE